MGDREFCDRAENLSLAITIQRHFMTIPEILQQFAHKDNKFPRAALEAATAQQEEITPHLLEILDYTAEHPDEVLDSFTTPYLYALYLLGQFRERRAYPLVLKLASLPPKTVDELLSDTISSGLPQILASVFDGDTAPLKALGQNQSAEIFVRTAVFHALTILVVHEVIAREEVIQYFAEVLDNQPDKDSDVLLGLLISSATLLYPEELFDQIKRKYEENLVDELCIGLDEIEEDLALGKEARLLKTRHDRHHQLIESAIKEMEWWYSYQEPPKSQSLSQALNLPNVPTLDRVSTYTAPLKVGRNDPCPCGSGKKYKKCCGQ